MKKHGKLLVVLMVLAMVFTLFSAPALADHDDEDSNSNAISISIIRPALTYYEEDTIDYRVRVEVPESDPDIDYYPARQEDIDVYLKLPGEDDYTLIHTIPELSAGDSWTSPVFPYVIDLDDADDSNVVRAFARCEGTAILHPEDEPSEAGVSIGTTVFIEELTVSKTVDTYFERTHEWDIDKWVETDEGEFINGTPKIWLDQFDNEYECATWYVDVTYEGYDDHDYNVSGMVTIENTGTAPAEIISVEDLLGGALIDVDFEVDFPYTLPVGETLEGSYSEDDYFEGDNVVTVTTERDTYGATEPIVWGEPDEEFYATVNIKDISDLFDEVDLGSVTAPNGELFWYDECFDIEDYESGSYTFENTATIIETGQYAEAILKLNVREENLDVTKTVETSFNREHFWDIDKWVETDEGHELNGYPKIWLVPDGSGDECAEWTIDVTYEGSEDFAHRVWGTVTIENTGDLDAVITDVEDLLGGSAITVDFGVTFPYTLAVGETLSGTYDEDGYFEGDNVVTVTTERDTYGTTEPIVWGDPDEEINATVNIVDESDLFGNVALGSVTAPNGDTFTYDKCFAWADYDSSGPHIYDNTATIVETGQYAEARLVVNWEPPDEVCYESAWAKADENYYSFCDNGFSNWGWSNLIGPGEYEWEMWAGAAQCDTNKGTHVGTAYVNYDGTDVFVTVEVFDGYTLDEDSVAVYAGEGMFPLLRNGRPTTAPGQYTIMGPFSGQDIYVIVHANVGHPDFCEPYAE